ncbi:regulator protein PecM [Cellvibrio japonicus Ueda107]|uniref:Regulator protein PecM n=1 Tax=Cellvibrio japonicus (strain Ueda107) TaxID=498211 RepID=B3PD40_CELJU|nr:regulator protein PecM [Cellvibrio japonicus Ueda107]
MGPPPTIVTGSAGIGGVLMATSSGQGLSGQGPAAGACHQVRRGIGGLQYVKWRPAVVSPVNL